MTALTWADLPKLKDGHPSNRDRRGAGIGVDTYGCVEFEWVPVPCGEWFDGGTALCDDHEALYMADYPQGWHYYPGDVCVHGHYTGGSGIDWMCGYCETGETEWVDSPGFTLHLYVGDPRPDLGVGTVIATWGQEDIVEDTIARIIQQAGVWSDIVADAPDPTAVPELNWTVTQTRDGYWMTPTDAERYRNDV